MLIHSSQPLLTRDLLKPEPSFVPFCKEAIEQTLVQRFEQQVKLHPDKIALKTKYGSLTYDAVNQAANRMAHAIIARCGYGEEPVAILQEQGPFFVPTILGILKAGKFYVPLDLSYSRQRVVSILIDAQIRLLIADTQNAAFADEALNAHLECGILDCEELDDTLSIENPDLHLSSDSPAYIFYTSGTTGRSKGVVDNHRNVLHNIMRYTNALYISANDHLTLLQAYSFSGSVSNIFGSLLNGATLCHFDPQKESVHALAAWLEQEAITIYHSVPAIFRSFPKDGRTFSSIRVIRLEGDQASRRDVELYKLHFSPECLLVNGLGATECGIVRQYFIGKDTELPPGAAVPIGYPTTDMKIVLLDDDGQEVEAGQIGEIVVESEYLAIGYWRDCDRTSAVFRSGVGTVRRYHSGDLGRFTPDNCLEYRGRKNFQAKLRGHLVDYGEVEAVLLRIDGVAEAVALIREDQPGEQRLVAYLVLAKQPTLTITSIRNKLAQDLPEYMIPSAYVMLDALPLNSNKKVDRKALPQPSEVRPVLETIYAAPQTALERCLTEMWKSLLHINQVGIHDDFFELGGDSLQASRFLAQLYQTYQVELPLREVFNNSTIAQLAASIAPICRSTPGSSIKVLQRTHGYDSFPASFAQRRLWFLDQLQHGSPVYNISEAYSFKGDLHIVALEQSLNELIRRHETLRTTFMMIDDQLVQRIAPDLRIVLSLYNLEGLSRHEREATTMQLAVAEARRPFDLEIGPLLRARLLRLTQTEHVLLLTLHHIISDGWSMSILYQELAILYDAYLQGKSSPLADLPVQYADYAAWQQEWLRDRVLESQLAYWKQQLAGAPPVLELPIDKPRPSVETFRGAYESFMLPSSLIAELENIARREGTTLFMILLAAFLLLLSHYSRQDDIVVGTDVANRGRAEIERLVGFFVNQLVLRADLSGDPTFGELLQRVRTVVLDAYEHQDVPFDQLVKMLNPVRRPDRSPLFQVKLVLQNIPVIPSSRTVAIAPLRVDNGTAQLDLLLALHEVASGLQGIWQYNTDLFEVKTIARMSQHFSVLLETLATSLSCKLSDMKALLDEADKQQRHSHQHHLAQMRHRRLKTVQTKPYRISE